MRGAAKVALATALATVVLAGSSFVGLQLPGLRLLDPFRDSGQVNYGAWPSGRLPPLRAQFLDERLGVGPGGSAPRHDRHADTATLRTTPGHAMPGRTSPARVVLEHSPDNDDFERAVDLPSVPFTARTTGVGATRQPGEPASCSTVQSGTLWYRYTPAEDARLIAGTAGSGFSTGLAVFRGRELRGLAEVGCTTAARGNASVPFVARARETYWFQVSVAVPAGALVFTLDPQPTTTRVSVSANGTEANNRSFQPFLSSDGRFIFFGSFATNLHPGWRQWRGPQGIFCPLDTQEPLRTVEQHHETAACQAVWYVHDRSQQSLDMVDLSSPDPECGDVAPNAMSDDGQRLLFVHYANGPACSGGDGERADVYVHDRRTGRDEAVHTRSPDTWDYGDNMSADGRYVAFESDDGGLVPGDTNGIRDVFVRDMATGSIVRVSVNSAGAQQTAAGPKARGAIVHSMSRNGRFVSFRSDSANLVAGDTNGIQDMFMHDIVTGRTLRVSVGSNGEQANDAQPTSPWGTKWNISDDGRYVAFVSAASNLVPNDANASADYFVRDTLLGVTERISVSTDGGEQIFGNRPTGDVLVLAGLGGYNPYDTGLSMTPDGRFIAFQSAAMNLVPGDDNDEMDIFVRDRLLQTTTRVSVSTEGRQASGGSVSPRISADGTVIAFTSAADNLVDRDTNGLPDVFVHERSSL